MTQNDTAPAAPAAPAPEQTNSDAQRQSKGTRGHVVPSDAQPASPVVVSRHQWHDVPQDDFARAWDWAVEQFTRRYPAQYTNVETLQSLIHQYLASHGKLPDDRAQR